MSFFDAKGNLILSDTLLWSGEHTEYAHNIILAEDALKFNELVVVLEGKSITLPVIDNRIISSGTINNYKMIDCNVRNYTSTTKRLELMTAAWESKIANYKTTLTAVYGRY